MIDDKQPGEGLLIVYTGNGKGKTTAAFGLALRAAGQGLRICIIQFIKGAWPTGEAAAIARLPSVELHVQGTGFTWRSDLDAVKRAAAVGWQLAREKVLSGSYDLIILDELTYLIRYGLLAEVEVLDLCARRPGGLHLVITGREATPGLITAADLVTEMREVKHPHRRGDKARKGIEY